MKKETCVFQLENGYCSRDGHYGPCKKDTGQKIENCTHNFLGRKRKRGKKRKK